MQPEQVTEDSSPWLFNETLDSSYSSELSYQIHQLAGKPANAGWGAIENQFKLISEEFTELQDAINERDTLKLRDAIGDLLTTVYGAAWRAGLDADEDMYAIYRSNMSKFDTDEDTASRTRDKYAQLGLEVETVRVMDGPKVYYTTRVTHEQVVDGKLYPRGKLVKSVNFKEPVFIPLPEAVIERLGQTE